MNTRWIAACVLLAAAPVRAQTADVSGHWQGSIAAQGMDLNMEVDLAKNSNGELVGTISIPTENLKSFPLSSVTVDGRSIRFVLQAMSGGGPFDGDVSADGKVISGTFIARGSANPFAMARTGDARIAPPARSPRIGTELEGVWNGTLDAGGRQLHLVLKMTNQPDGTATGSLDGTGVELPVTMTQQGYTVTVDAAASGSSYVGVLNALGTELTGTYTQGSVAMPLTFRRAGS